MRECWKKKNLILLLLSVVVIYFLGPTLDYRIGILVSITFALINILSSRIIENKQYIKACVLYTLISVVSYFLLFNDQPWDFLFGEGTASASAVPVIGCSIMMSLAGWLLLRDWKNRIYYLLITLGLQVPIGILVGTNIAQEIFVEFAHTLYLVEQYAGSWRAYQFEWMLTYYLPIYFLAHKTKCSE